MDTGQVEHRLAAILSADVVAYSRLMAADEEATVRTLNAYRAEIGLLVQQHRGRVVDFPGDNFLAEFPTAIDAVRCAVAIQRVLEARNADLPAERKMEFRMGIHLGDVRVEEERIYGDGVNIAARLEALAESGSICISATVHEQVRNKLEVVYRDLGDQSVKNLPDQVRVYQVDLAPSAGRRTGEQRGARRAALLGLAALLLLALGGPLVWWLVPGPAVTPASGVPSLAVLPFDNISGDPEQEYFSDGLSEDLITDLSKISGLIVISRKSSFSYKGKPIKVQDVGRELDVRYVLEGSVRRAGDRVRITAQLVETSNGHHVWADRYDRSIEDIFELQDEVTQEIVRALEVRISDSEQTELQRVPTENLEAYDLYQRAAVYGQRYGMQANQRAQALLERAIELDPEFGPAYALLASLHVSAWYGHWAEDPRTLERAEELADRALELDDSQVVSLVSASAVYAPMGRVDDALAAARRAVELSPNSASAHGVLASALLRAERPEQAMRELERAARLDPLDPVPAFTLGIQHFLRREYDQALAVLKRAVNRTPDFIGLHGSLAVTYAEMDRMEEARSEVAEMHRISPGFSLEELAARNLAGLDPESSERILSAARKAGLR